MGSKRTKRSKAPEPSGDQGDETSDALADALNEARKSPGDEAAWDQVEILAATLQRPDEVAELYKEVLSRDLPPVLAATLGKRGASFLEEWYGENSPGLLELLTRVVALDPGSGWAFQRLTVAHTVSGRWDDLLGLYETAITQAIDKERRISLLTEAANVARDFAQYPDRAIGYLEQLVEHKPDDAQLSASLERLLERQEQWQGLINFWSGRLSSLPTPEANAARVRIAECYLDRLDQPREALDQARTLLGEGVEDEAATQLLERIAAMGTALAPVRIDAMSVLKDYYIEQGRSKDVVRTLEAALALADRDQSPDLHSELGEQLKAQGLNDEAMGHFTELLRLDPSSRAALAQLRELAKLTGNTLAFAEALEGSADPCEDVGLRVSFRLEAAVTRSESLEDPQGAIALYRQVLDEPKIETPAHLEALRRIGDLYEASEQKEEQLDALERQAKLEEEPQVRMAVLGRAARLADELGQTNRALDLWWDRIEKNRADVEALDAAVGILEREESWESLIGALRQRAAAPVPELQRRVDLVRIARVQAERLEDLTGAITSWLEVQEQFGKNAETIDALANLFSSTGQWGELATLLEEATSNESRHVADMLAWLGDAFREELGEPSRALDYYLRAQRIDLEHERTLAGLTALLEDEDCRPKAAEALSDTYDRTDRWSDALGLLEFQLAGASNDKHKVRILRGAAKTQEERAEDLKAALGSLCRAFPLAPDNVLIENDITRLAEATGVWEPVAVSVHEAADEASELPRELHLRTSEATIAEEHLKAPDVGLQAYSAVLKKAADRLDAAEGVIRMSGQLQQWEPLAEAVLTSAKARAELSPKLISAMEDIADASGVWNELVSAVETTLTTSSDVPPAVGRDLDRLVARWHEERRGDADAAEAAFRRGSSREGEDLEVLQALARLQRRNPGRELYDTLARVSNLVLGDNDLDPLYEAATLALDPINDPKLAVPTLERLYREASGLWRGERQAAGKMSPEGATRWALEELIRIREEAGEHEATVTLLGQGGQLPLAPESWREMRKRAGAICAGPLNDRSRAITLYRSILDETPNDAEAVQMLAEACETEGRLPELLDLRKHELSLNPDPERVLVLRLDIARLVGELAARGGRLEALKANLGQRPGHPDSIKALIEMLEEARRYDDLADLLTEQAAKLSEAADGEQASELWAKVADLAEERLDNIERAIHSHSQVAELTSAIRSLDALARLHQDRGENADAARWLARRLEATEGEERTAIALQLANTRLAAGQQKRAIACLEAAHEEAPSSTKIRDLLAEQYRKTEAWEPLARLLTRAAQHVEDDATLIDFAREAATIYGQLGSPDKAIEGLRKAAKAVPDDQELRRMLADGLLVAGQHEEGEAILVELIEQFGRRRNTERASLHYKLAQIKKGQGDFEEALVQLETASSMAVGNTRIMGTLAQLSKEAGQHDRAERTYRALLMVVRRQQPEDDDALGQSEVLYELHQLALEREQGDQAEELMRLALQAVAGSRDESRRFRRAMLERGEHELLLKALTRRVDAAAAGEELAEVLEHVAEVLEEHLSRSVDAFDSRLKALEEAPDAWHIHDKTRTLAASLTLTDKYVETLKDRIERTRRKSDANLATDLLERLGQILEEDVGDLDGAAEAFSNMVGWGARPAEARLALARVSLKRHDTDEAIRLLEKVVGDESAPQATCTDARYRLARVQLGSEVRRQDGLASLECALKEDADYERAGAILRDVTTDGTDDPSVLAIYRNVAKASEEPELLLDYYRKRSVCFDVTLAELREGVNVAIKREDEVTADSILMRAIDIALSAEEGLTAALWAPITLAQRRQATGDLHEAVLWMQRAAEATPDSQRAFELWLEAASIAVEGKDLAAAVEVYERLFETDPLNALVWKPLLEVVCQTGDEEQLVVVVNSVIEKLPEESDRNVVRLIHAKFLSTISGREPDAADVLRTVLANDKGHTEASSLLADLFERTGYDEDLAELLTEQAEEAYRREDHHTVHELTLRLGKLLERVRLDDAKAVYRRALKVLHDDREIAEALLAVFSPEDDPRERVDLLERPLAHEEGEAGAQLALTLADEWEALEDDDGVRRVLNRGYEACPEYEPLRERLEKWYQGREEWRPLAELLTAEAARRDTASVSVALLRNASAIYLEALKDAASAATALSTARTYEPTNLGILEELVQRRSQASQHQIAIDEVTTALEEHGDSDVRPSLLRMRANLHIALGMTGNAVADLEEAYAIVGHELEFELIAGLETHLQSLSGTDDVDAQRPPTLRLVEVLKTKGEIGRARELISEWLARAPQDLEALYQLRTFDEIDERWEAVAATCSQLVMLDTAEAQVDAVRRLVNACERLERPEDSRTGLERVHEDQPEDTDVRNLLWKLYEQIGATRELASMYIVEALRVEEPEERYGMLRRAGELYLQTREGIPMAVEPLEEALRIKPADHETIVLLVDAYIASQSLERAQELLEQTIAGINRRGPQLAELQHRMARIAGVLGDRNTQLQWLNAALDSNKRDGYVAADLAEIAMELGDHTVALKALRVVTVSRRESPLSLAMAFLYQAQIAMAKGEKRQAQMWARRALSEDAELEAAVQFLDELGN